MKRNVFGALIVAGGLVLATSVASLASTKTQGDFSAAANEAKAAIATCASTPALTDPATLGLTGEAATEAAALKAETLAGIGEIVTEANGNIDEAVAENAQGDAAQDAAELTAELTEIVKDACQAIVNLKAEYEAALVELKAESTTPEVDKADVEKQDVEKPEKPEQPEVRSTTREGND